jgi:hypothetical protein
MDVETIRSLQGSDNPVVVVGRGRMFVKGTPPNRSPLDDLVRLPGHGRTVEVKGDCMGLEGDMHIALQCDQPRSWSGPLDIDMAEMPPNLIRELAGNETATLRVGFGGEFSDEGEPVLHCSRVLQVARPPALPPPAMVQQEPAPRRQRQVAPMPRANGARYVIIAIRDKLIGGHFATEEEAERQLKELQSDGYRPVVRPKRYPTVESAEKALQAKIPGWKPGRNR